MLIGRLVYRMEYCEPLPMSQFSFGIFPLFAFRHSCHVFNPYRDNLLKSDTDMSWSLMTDLGVNKRKRVAGMEPATLK